MPIVIRVRSQLGTWRLKDVEASNTMASLRERIEKEHHTDLEGRPFSSDPGGKELILDECTVGDLNMANGQLIYAMVDEAKTGVHEAATTGKMIAKDGSIVAQEYENVVARTGFRPGMMPLRDMKMQWRLDEYVALDEQFEYKLKRQKEAMAAGIQVDAKSMQNFQAYCLSTLDFQQMRVGYLYGTIIPPTGVKKEEKEEAKKVDSIWSTKAKTVGGTSVSSSSSSGDVNKMDAEEGKGGEAEKNAVGNFEESGDLPSARVEFIYEPPQSNTDTTFSLEDDPMQEVVDKLAGNLGVQKVGWIFAHPPREDNFHFAAAEIIEAAEQQLIAAEGINDTPFVTIKVTIDPKTDLPIAEGFQVSKQAMEMTAEGALEIHPLNPGSSKVNDTFTAYVEHKPTKEVDNDFFLINVPIAGYDSELFISDFPRLNRLGTMQSREDLKQQLQRAGKQGWTFQALLADFQLLLFLGQFLDHTHDLPMICKSIVDKNIPLDEGHALIIRSLAGIN